MAWQVYGHNWESGELANTALYQPYRMNKNILVKAIRTWIVVYGDPTFTDLCCKIYSDELRNSIHTPVTLLHTSDSRTKAEIITENYGVRETWFEFTNPISLQALTWYNVVINGTGYSPTTNSYLAWRHAFPDPVLTTDYVASAVNIPFAPFDIYFIGGDY